MNKKHSSFINILLFDTVDKTTMLFIHYKDTLPCDKTNIKYYQIYIGYINHFCIYFIYDMLLIILSDTLTNLIST